MKTAKLENNCIVFYEDDFEFYHVNLEHPKAAMLLMLLEEKRWYDEALDKQVNEIVRGANWVGNPAETAA